jgi:hypothetical protein
VFLNRFLNERLELIGHMGAKSWGQRGVSRTAGTLSKRAKSSPDASVLTAQTFGDLSGLPAATCADHEISGLGAEARNA